MTWTPLPRRQRIRHARTVQHASGPFDRDRPPQPRRPVGSSDSGGVAMGKSTAFTVPPISEEAHGHHLSLESGHEPIFNAPTVEVWGKTGTADAQQISTRMSNARLRMTPPAKIRRVIPAIRSNFTAARVAPRRRPFVVRRARRTQGRPAAVRDLRRHGLRRERRQGLRSDRQPDHPRADRRGVPLGGRRRGRNRAGEFRRVRGPGVLRHGALWVVVFASVLLFSLVGVSAIDLANTDSVAPGSWLAPVAMKQARFLLIGIVAAFIMADCRRTAGSGTSHGCSTRR